MNAATRSSSFDWTIDGPTLINSVHEIARAEFTARLNSIKTNLECEVCDHLKSYNDPVVSVSYDEYSIPFKSREAFATLQKVAKVVVDNLTDVEKTRFSDLEHRNLFDGESMLMFTCCRPEAEYTKDRGWVISSKQGSLLIMKSGTGDSQRLLVAVAFATMTSKKPWYKNPLRKIVCLISVALNEIFRAKTVMISKQVLSSCPQALLTRVISHLQSTINFEADGAPQRNSESYTSKRSF